MTTNIEARGVGVIAGLVMGILLLGAGCIIEADPTTDTADAESAQSATVRQPNAEPAPAAAKPDHIWPPRLGERYPNLRLRTPSGERIELASLEGRVILVEPIGMDCPACNAFAGGNRPGMSGFQGVQPQGGVPSIDEMLDQYAGGLTLDDDRLILVHLLLYRPGRDGPPKLETARLWAKHFRIEESENVLVLVGEPYLIGPASYKMVPGFQLVDKNFVLRFDAAGHNPTHSIWRDLLPAVASLLGEVRPTL
ncbi:MAG: hypothetical protein JRD03_05145 [Deltaproteobacteria bacterium]|nr:hypothetical protein [Deltaproteobacteria bacterium]